MKLNAEWTDDCQGKKDYDGDILAISTRYWPGNRQANGFVSAKSSLIIRHGKDDYAILTSKEFEAGTFEELAPQVELWAQEQMDKAVAVLKAAFATH